MNATLHPITQEDIAGTCPACGELVSFAEPDGPVWTCPADLATENRYAEAPLYPELHEKWEAEGYFGRCGEDVGLSCYDPMPLHSACYEQGDY
jgi:hypothetical protein